MVQRVEKVPTLTACGASVASLPLYFHPHQISEWACRVQLAGRRFSQSVSCSRVLVFDVTFFYSWRATAFMSLPAMWSAIESVVYREIFGDHCPLIRQRNSSPPVVHVEQVSKAGATCLRSVKDTHSLVKSETLD